MGIMSPISKRSSAFQRERDCASKCIVIHAVWYNGWYSLPLLSFLWKSLEMTTVFSPPLRDNGEDG